MEHDRLDQFFEMIFEVALGGPIGPVAPRLVTPRGVLRALDIGFGTGMWLYKMLERYPNAHLVGIDAAPPEQRYPKPDKDLQFLGPVDFESEDWGLPESSFDLINMSQLCGSVANWSRLCTNARR